MQVIQVMQTKFGNKINLWHDTEAEFLTKKYAAESRIIPGLKSLSPNK